MLKSGSILGQLSRLFSSNCAGAQESRPCLDERVPHCPVEIVHVNALSQRCGFREKLALAQASLQKPLNEWRMEDDDSPIFRYLYRNHQPRRHLEFGTWQGTGTLYCLEESAATVWTINLPDGEATDQGNWAYSTTFPEGESLPTWANKKVYAQTWYQTDAGGFIGRYFREKGLGHRVCQIYCDSRRWDISNYPPAFFDSVLIDGGHKEEVVGSDTEKAVQVVRPGGLVLWHDFCPDPVALENCSSTRGVAAFVKNQRNWLEHEMRDLFWIQPSWILVGVKR